MRDIKEGDIVICVDAECGDCLTEGKEYVVKSTKDDKFIIIKDDNGDTGGWFNIRFRKKGVSSVSVDYAEATLEKIWIEYGDSELGTKDAIRIDWSNDRHQRIDISGRSFQHLITALDRTVDVLIGEKRNFKI